MKRKSFVFIEKGERPVIPLVANDPPYFFISSNHLRAMIAYLRNKKDAGPEVLSYLNNFERFLDSKQNTTKRPAQIIDLLCPIIINELKIHIGPDLFQKLEERLTEIFESSEVGTEY